MIEGKNIEAFITEILSVCIKHNMIIDHEDSGGMFLISPIAGFELEQLGSAGYSSESDMHKRIEAAKEMLNSQGIKHDHVSYSPLFEQYIIEREKENES